MSDNIVMKQLKRFVFRFRQWRHRQIAPQVIQTYVDTHDVRKLQVGAGPTQHTGWLNTTLQPIVKGTAHLDATKPFPIADNSFDYVFSEHMIEHIPYQAGQNFIRESFRVLRTGGTIRIATPDLAQIMKLYTHPQEPTQRAYNEWIVDTFIPHADADYPSFVINQSYAGWFHIFIYDRPTLEKCITDAGFIDVQWCLPNESDDEVLQGIENHGNVIGNDEMMRYETMIIQAKKP